MRLSTCPIGRLGKEFEITVRRGFFQDRVGRRKTVAGQCFKQFTG